MSCGLFSYVGIKHILFRSLDIKFEPELNLVHEGELDEYICFDGVFDRHQFCKLQQSLAYKLELAVLWFSFHRFLRPYRMKVNMEFN